MIQCHRPCCVCTVDQHQMEFQSLESLTSACSGLRTLQFSSIKIFLSSSAAHSIIAILSTRSLKIPFSILVSHFMSSLYTHQLSPVRAERGPSHSVSHTQRAPSLSGFCLTGGKIINWMTFIILLWFTARFFFLCVSVQLFSRSLSHSPTKKMNLCPAMKISSH